MHFLIYVSSAVTAFSRAELVALLEQCRNTNTRLGIAGMLLYKDGNIMQVLEGERETVRTLYAKIACDPRHKGLLVLLEGALEARQFPNWSMAFRDWNDADVRLMPGFSEFLNSPLTSAEFSSDPTRCQRLLGTFKQRM